MAYTLEAKKAYYKQLRAEQKEAKKSAEEDAEAKARFELSQIDISYTSFYIIERQMRANNFDGLPYVDAKTFKKWREEGLSVKKGAKSVLQSVTWIHPKGKNGDDDESKLFPKVYHLFHRSQVEKC
jgi:hypothetical protein